MLKNFFSIAYRNLIKNKAFSIINIAGLAIGMAAAALICMVILHQKSYDQFHEKKARIYEAWNRATFSGELHCWNTTPKPLARAVESDLPEVECATRVDWGSNFLFTIGEKKIKANGKAVDTTFLKIFTFPMKQGDPMTALNDPFSIIVTETFAKKFFGNENPMGKVLKVDNKDNLTVTGVLQDPPANTRFEFEYLYPWSYRAKRGWDDTNWGNNSTRTYVLLKENASLANANEKLKSIKGKYDKDAENWQMFLYPLDRWRLYSRFKGDVEDGGLIDDLRIFGIIAIFLLLIACINFMNLSTARSEKRAKEVGIRKVVGAKRFSLIGHFVGESILLASISGILSLGFLLAIIPSFNKLIDEKLSLHLTSPLFWIAWIGFIVVTGLVAGSYPAFFMSSFNPSSVLKGTFKAANTLITPRKLLVVLQFTFAIIMIICTSIVKQQLDHAKNRESGYDRSQLVYTNMEGDIEKNYSLIRNELLSSGAVSSVTKTSAPLTQGWSDSWGFKWEGMGPNDDKLDFDIFCEDQDLVKTAGLEMAEGRDFDLNTFKTDSTAILINQSAQKVMKFDHPIGQIIRNGDQDQYHVVGVIKDFVLNSPFQPTRPMMINGVKGWFSIVHYKLNKDHAVADNLKKIEAIYKKYNPEYPFSYKFIDEEYDTKFKTEQRMGTMASIFAGLTIFISCLGLFGLATYMAENRIKEIGVRKVLGASVTGITALLSKDFLRLVMYSFLVATPVAWWLMHKWLSQYPYRVGIDWKVFVFAGFMSFLISILTVSYQSIKAAIANPVQSLRTE
ncbi:MAG: ABC transporter permease [Saprospiraceae bacterium]